MPESPAPKLRQFHEAFDIARADRPGLPHSDIAGLRQRLLEEEVAELAEAVHAERLDHIAHELADVVYVAYGTALAYGVDLDTIIDEVHRANMSKLAANGEVVRRDDGKVLKSDSYEPPDVAAVLTQQGWTPPG